MKDILYRVGAFGVLLALVLIITPWQKCSPILYLAGSSLFVWGQYKNRPQGRTLAFRRICRIQQIGDVVLLLVSLPLSMNIWHWSFAQHGEWLLLLTIAAWIELYTAFRLDYLIKRGKQ